MATTRVIGTTAGAFAPDTTAEEDEDGGEYPSRLKPVSPDELLGSAVDERDGLKRLPEHRNESEHAQCPHHDWVHLGIVRRRR